jgi:hypothetical protein
VSDKALSPLRRRMVEDRTIKEYTKHQQGQDSNDEPDAIGDAVMFLTSSSETVSLDSVEVFKVLKDRFVPCRSKIVVRLVTRKLSNVLFLPHVTP